MVQTVRQLTGREPLGRLARPQHLCYIRQLESRGRADWGLIGHDVRVSDRHEVSPGADPLPAAPYLLNIILARHGRNASE